MQRFHFCAFSLLIAQPTLTMTLLGCTGASGSGVATSNGSVEAREHCAAEGCEIRSGEPPAATGEKNLPAPFFALRTDSIRTCDIRLPLAEGLGLKPACEERVDESAPLEVWRTRLDFGFGPVTREQFDALVSGYSGWSPSRARVAYSEYRRYWLSDFLPPVAAGLNGHRFEPALGEASDELFQAVGLALPSNRKETFSLYSNCWGTTWEVLRGDADGFTVFMGAANLMLKELRSRTTLLAVAQEPEQLPFRGVVQPGDVLLVLHENGDGEFLDHTAVFIDDGILFEKAGTGKDVPIRLTDFETLRKIWMPGVFRYELRRPQGTARFEHPLRLFSLASPALVERFPGLIDLTGSLSRFARETTMDWSMDGDRLESAVWFRSMYLPLQ